MGVFGSRSSLPNRAPHTTTTQLESAFQRKHIHNSQRREWTPPALHPATLILAILTPLALILTLVLLLRRSQRDNGIIFAPDVNALPLSRTFMYQYFPTMLTVLFSIFWAWIDLEVKRLEPYYRLSEKEGALGKDSLLLAYPFGFVPLVPMKAFRQKHWPVFWASLSLLLVTWGLVPTQAAIFSTDRITRNVSTSFEVSMDSMPIEKQEDSLTMRFSQSSYGIVSLNETLPQFMTRNYTLAPFRPSSGNHSAEYEETTAWTAPTMLYSLDLNCSPAMAFNDSGVIGWSREDCKITGALSGNETFDTNPEVARFTAIKPFSAQYIGYWNRFGYADFYLSSSCPVEKNHTFFAAFTRNKEKDTDPVQDVTAIFCEPAYYSQKVNATVDKASNRPIHITPLGSKQPLNDTNTIFNTTWLEMILNGGYPENRVREDEFPSTQVPNFIDQMTETNLTIANGRQPLVGFSTFIVERPLEDFLDWRTLARSYEDSYRLLFARAMVDVLGDGFTTTEKVAGERTVVTEAVVLEPIFTYVVIGVLGVIAVATMMVLYLTMIRTLKLYSDPSTIGSAMGLVADSKALLQDFEDLDCCTFEELQQTIQQKRYRLVGQNDYINLIEEQPTTPINRHGTLPMPTIPRARSSKAIDKPVRPIEFTFGMSALFVVIFTTLAVLLATVFIKAKANGLPLPSQSNLVQNLLENYIPTAIATLIEPLWVLINRLLCLLQPIEALQSCKAKADESIDLNYSSLPPQLVIIKSLRARHYVLATVCFMALLANILAIAFAGLFHHSKIAVLYSADFHQPFDLRFVPINASIGPSALQSFGTDRTPSGAYRGGDGTDQFFILESNRSRGTPLPPWTDQTLFYFPFMEPGNTNSMRNDQFESETATLGSELDCEAIDPREIRIVAEQTGTSKSILNRTVLMGSVQASCSSSESVQIIRGPSFDPITLERECQNGASAIELVMNLEPLSANVTQEEKEACWGTVLLGWVRNQEGTCKSPKLPSLDAKNSLFLQCQPRLVRGRAAVRVDTGGRLVKKSQTINPEQTLNTSEIASMFETGPLGLIGQSNRYIFSSNFAPWHNDTVATDFLNYFIQGAANDSRFLDPHKSVPTWEDIQIPLQKTYSSLFAIWLGANRQRLLVPRSDNNKESKNGWIVTEEERVFLSVPLFAIAQGILCTYALVACVVYFRRPGQYLATLPTSLASVIALFAGSTVVRGMGGISGLSKRARAERLEALDYRYGYGSYVGLDGRVHIGIEKAPFVRPWKKTASA